MNFLDVGPSHRAPGALEVIDAEFLTALHPAIANGVSRCCQHIATPTPESFAAAKRILAWLEKRADLGIVWGAPHLKTIEQLLLPDHDVLPMSAERDYRTTRSCARSTPICQAAR